MLQDPQWIRGTWACSGNCSQIGNGIRFFERIHAFRWRDESSHHRISKAMQSFDEASPKSRYGTKETILRKESLELFQGLFFLFFERSEGSCVELTALKGLWGSLQEPVFYILSIYSSLFLFGCYRASCGLVFSRVPFCVLVSGNWRLLDRCLGMEMRCFEEKPYTFLFSKGYGKGIIK